MFMGETMMSSVGESLLKGAAEALSYAKGDKKNAVTHKVNLPKNVDVSQIRHHLKMSRKMFSEEFCFSLRTLEKWERGERVPEGPTRAYLMVIAENPMAVRNALKQTSHSGTMANIDYKF